MPSVSKKQQKFMGIVRAIQKGEEPASKFSKSAQKAAKKMKKSSVKKYAKTKHDDLPTKKEGVQRDRNNLAMYIIDLNNVSHNVLEMHWKGDDLVGTVEVLGTPAGNILKELFKSGIKLGISSRGLGSVEELGEADEKGEPTVKVQPDFELIAFDFVSNPSTHGAFMRPVNESVQHTSPEKNIEKIVNDIMRG